MTFETKNNFILQCAAYDFDTVQISIEHDDKNYGMYLSTLSSNFYGLQRYSIFKQLWFRLKLAWHVLIGKEYRLFDLCLNKEDMQAFKKFINDNIE